MEVEEVFARFRQIKQSIRARRKSGSSTFGDHRSSLTGSGYDIVGIDEWRRGQPLKDLAWKLNLRTYPERLFKIERIEPKAIRTLLVADLSYSTLFELSRESNKALLLLEAIGSIGLTRASMHDPVGLLAFSDRIELYLKPKLGSDQIFYMVHQMFEKLRLEREFPARRRANFSVALQFIAARLKSPHSIVLLSDLVDLDHDPAAMDFALLGRLAWKHDIVALILDDPEEYVLPRRFGYIRTSNMETGAQTVISACKADALQKRLVERRRALQARLERECHVDSVVLTPSDGHETLFKFLRARTSR